jgi:hypothetical protein
MARVIADRKALVASWLAVGEPAHRAPTMMASYI